MGKYLTVCKKGKEISILLKPIDGINHYTLNLNKEDFYLDAFKCLFEEEKIKFQHREDKENNMVYIDIDFDEYNADANNNYVQMFTSDNLKLANDICSQINTQVMEYSRNNIVKEEIAPQI